MHALHEKRQVPYLLFLCLGVLALLPFLLLTLYNHPQADDYGFAVRDTTYSFWETHKTFYLNWTGRYFSTNTAFHVNPLIYRAIGSAVTVYKLYSLLLILLLGVSTFFLLFKLLSPYFKIISILALAVLLLCLYLLQMQSVSEGIFWLSGYLTYQLPNILMLLMLALLVGFFKTGDKTVKTAYVALAALFCVAIVGSNEMSVVMAFTTTLFLLYNNWNGRKNRPYLLFLFLACVAACLVAVLAPGNYARMEDHPNASRPLWATVYAFFLTGLSFYRWLAPLLAASMLYLFYWGLPLAQKAKALGVFQVSLRTAVLYFLVTLFLMQFAFTWAVGERPTPRVENVIYFFFVFGWFYILQVAVIKYARLLQAERNLSPALPVAAFVLFTLFLFDIDKNVATAYVDLFSGKAAAYDRAMYQRYDSLQASRCDTCALAPLPAIPQSVYFLDLMEGEENSSFWVNRDFADYWNKSGVYLSSPNPVIKDNTATLRETGKQALQQ